MLILTRKEGESILIDKDIEVKVCHIYHDGRVRVGINAPDKIRIVRAEKVGRLPRISAVHHNGDQAYEY
jgi:carbon storage regulator